MSADFNLVLKDLERQPTSVAEGKVSINENGYADSAVHVYKPGMNRSLMNIKASIQSWELQEYNPPAALIYDLFFSYQPEFAALPLAQMWDNMNEYIRFFQRHLRHGAMLAVQLDDGVGKETAIVEPYNKLVLQQLSEHGFNLLDPSTCKKYEYEREEDHTTGTLYVFTNQGYALGEHDPRTSTGASWMDEVAAIVNEGLAQKVLVER
jgi:hypothetical protein